MSSIDGKVKAAASHDEDLDLWRQFKKTGAEELRNRLVERYLPQVRYAAERLAARLPGSVEVTDLMQEGAFGLMDAIEKFDLSKEVRFESYCHQRIRGAMLDSIRAADWVPRLVRTNVSLFEQAWNALEVDLGRAPTDLEMASHLGISLEELDRMGQSIQVASMVSYHREGTNQEGRQLDFLEDTRELGPITGAARRELIEMLGNHLSYKEKLVVVLYYYEKFTLREIGETLGLTESRICQIHTRVMNKLRARLQAVRTDLMAER